MKTYKFTQTKEIANALSNVKREAFYVDFTGNNYGVGDFAVICHFDTSDDTIAVGTLGWGSASWFNNTPEGRAKAFDMLT